MNPEIEAHLRSLVNFPSPPGVASHIIELARDPEIEMGKVAKALSMDSALSTKVLRIANSPLYAQRRKSENLRQALVVLGLNATLTLALSFSLVKSLRTGKANGMSHPLYWRRALIAATAARALADALRQSMAEEIFLAGLLQDVGMLALDQAVPDLYRGGESLQRDHAALAELEKKRLQVDHAAIGGWLMTKWNLPPRLCHAIEHSHQIDLQVSLRPGPDLRPLRRAVRPGGGSLLERCAEPPLRRNRALRRALRGLGQDGVRPGARARSARCCRRPRRSSRPISWPSSIRSSFSSRRARR